MNTEIKKKWVAALRSGKYEQGEGALKIVYSSEPNQFCCLGVLCDIYAEEYKIQWETDQPTGHAYLNFTENNKETGVLPEEVMEWAGLTQNNPDVVFEGNQSNLGSLNDGETIYDENDQPIENTKLTFLQIADVIEAQL